MHYHVTARLRPGMAAELRERLDSGAIARQEPDGREIVASMERATVTADGTVSWSEVCYCSPPLAHERETVYDRFFEITSIAPAEGQARQGGRRFLDLLGELADGSG